MDSFGTTFVTNHLAQLISKKFCVDQVLIASILGVLLTVNYKVEYTAPLLLLGSAVIAYVYFFQPYQDYNTLRIYGSSDWNVLTVYMEHNLHLFNGGFSSARNNPYDDDANHSPLENVRINFKDSSLNAEGYIISGHIEEDRGKERGVRLHKYIDIHIRKGMIHPNNYFAHLVEFKNRLNSSDMCLYFQIVYGDSDKGGAMEGNIVKRTVQMFKGVRGEYALRYERYINSYFNRERDWIWKYCSEIHFKPETFNKLGQEARLNMLLYGPTWNWEIISRLSIGR